MGPDDFAVGDRVKMIEPDKKGTVVPDEYNRCRRGYVPVLFDNAKGYAGVHWKQLWKITVEGDPPVRTARGKGKR